ncbi:MAG: bifunctional oligoribonuclease/PAP phosphatase NrnA [Ruminococcaceae bacterium]|nr:bifunctional oligoribonuclease/PAP phosphatase NrnA [Oscillospiraceae bacterium]
MFQKLLQLIEAHQVIIIHRHTNPDGDALGSQIGLKHLILENYPHKRVYMVGDDAGYLSFMDDSVMDTIADSDYEGALAIILDTASARLISDNRYTLAAATARMDHHLFQEQIAETEVVDDSFESCCGLIGHFAMQCGLRLNPLAAKSLYTGMITDSGRFRYDGTVARTFRIAAFLREQPFDPGDIFRKLYAEDFENRRLRALYTLKIQFTPNRVAYIYTTKEELDASGQDLFTIYRGMVSTMADLKGVDVWVNFTESDRGVLCELRSTDYNVNPIAVKYGGGGHAKACGATVADRETAMAMLQDLDRLVGEMK